MKGEKVKVKSAFKMADRNRKNPDSFPGAAAPAGICGPLITPTLLNSKIKRMAIPAQHPAHILFMSDTRKPDLSQGQKCLRSDERSSSSSSCLKISSPKELFPLFLFTLH